MVVREGGRKEEKESSKRIRERSKNAIFGTERKRGGPEIDPTRRRRSGGGNTTTTTKTREKRNQQRVEKVKSCN